MLTSWHDFKRNRPQAALVLLLLSGLLSRPRDCCTGAGNGFPFVGWYGQSERTRWRTLL